MVRSDELALREALADLTLGQPDLPVDRVAGVRRRFARRRAMQVGASAAAVVAVLAGVLTVIGSSGSPARPQPLQQPAPKSWQLDWPARYGDGSSTAAARAVAVKSEALAYYQAHLSAALRDVRLLYAGRAQGIPADWVVVEAASGTPETHQLIALASTDEDATWASYTMQAPPRTVRALGFAVGRRVFALAAPTVPSVGYVDLSSGTTRESAQVPVQHTDGVAVLDIGHAIRPNTLFVGDRYDSPFPVWWRDDTPGAGKLRQWQEATRTPAPGLQYLGFIAGAGGGGSATLRMPRDGTLTLVLRCAGPAGLRVRLKVADAGIGEQDQDGCDGTSSPAAGAVDVHVTRHEKVQVEPFASEFTVFSVAIFLGH